MTDIKVLIEWLDAICEEAKVAGQAGDASKANALALNGTLKYYFNNVYMLGVMSRATFGSVGTYVEEVERLYAADLEAQEQVRKINEAAQKTADLETKLAEQAAQIEKLMAFFEDAQAKAAKVTKKPKADDKPAEVEPQDQLDTEAE